MQVVIEIRKAFVFSVLWFTAAMAYYGITLSAGGSSNVYVQSFLIALASVPGQIGSAYFVRILQQIYSKRRESYTRVDSNQTDNHQLQQIDVDSIGVWIGVIVSSLISGLLFIVLILIADSAQWMQIIIQLIAQFFISLLYTLCYTFTSSAYPTIYRSRAVGIFVMIGRLGAILSPFIISIGDRDSNGLGKFAYTVMGASCIINSIGLLFIKNDIQVEID